MIFGAREEKLQLPDMELRYITFGRGTKPLLMIQGLNTRGIHGAAASLAYMYRIFAKDYRVYLFDRRPEVFDGITVRDMASDIAVAMDALGITKAHVFGVSQGGMIAQHLAMDRPDLVEKLVLAVTLSRNNETVRTVIENWIALTRQRNMKQLVRDMAEKMYSESYVKKYLFLMPLLTILQKPTDPERFMILAKSCLTCNTYEELEKIQCPVFVIGGGQDKIVGADASREIAQKLDCQCYIYEQLGHGAYEEAKDFNQRVYDFLQDKAEMQENKDGV